jgi:hypothetical protein
MGPVAIVVLVLHRTAPYTLLTVEAPESRQLLYASYRIALAPGS